ncbi:MAG: dihydrolipoyl dehydrogenase [Candidatus Accumulibacter sp.]|jgi:dihydrolipoamide dehydrogenase|nr:dihydrolipoyl dehydrogenase [Accumulibacter sp.]
MSRIIEVHVPDMGDFKDVPVIEICVKPGDAVKVEDSLLTMESDKASVDMPSPVDGVVRELTVAVGDKVSQGSLVALIETLCPASADAAAPEAPPPARTAPALAPAGAPAFEGAVDVECEMLVLGGGPGGYSAAFRSADLGLKTLLVERDATLGGVCLNVGCIPSKALLYATAVAEDALRLADCGVVFDSPKIDLDKLRAHKAKVVAKLTGGLTAMAKARKVDLMRATGRFLDAHHMALEPDGGGARKVVRFAQCIVAVGSAPVHLPFLPDDPRIVDSTGALELPFVPEKMLVIGGGIIGLEMASIYSALGARIDVVEMLDALMPGPDRDAVRIWEKKNSARFDRVMLGTKTVAVEARDDGVYARFESADGGAPIEASRYDMILQSVGRVPNGLKIDAEKAGVAVDARGFIGCDAQQRTNVPHIFAIGDVVGQPMLAHKAVHEGHVAAEVAAGLKSAFDAKLIPGVAYTHPEIAWAGVTEDAAKKEGRNVNVAKFPLAASGRAIASRADEGFSKLVFDAETERLIGGVLIGHGAGDMIGEVALAVEMGCDAVDIGRTIHPHPTFCESIGLAAELAHGVCTDLPPARKR